MCEYIGKCETRKCLNRVDYRGPRHLQTVDINDVLTRITIFWSYSIRNSIFQLTNATHFSSTSSFFFYFFFHSYSKYVRIFHQGTQLYRLYSLFFNNISVLYKKLREKYLNFVLVLFKLRKIRLRTLHFAKKLTLTLVNISCTSATSCRCLNFISLLLRETS